MAGEPPPDTAIRPQDVGGAVAWQELVRRGALAPIWGDVAAPADLTPTPHLRAQAIAALVPRGAIVADRAAAWVLCGAPRPAFLEVMYPPGTHRPSPRAGRVTRQGSAAPSELATFADIRVTGPLRTALDLATRQELDTALEAITWLVRCCDLDLVAARRHLDLRERWDGRRRARDVLTEAAGRLAG